MAASPWTDATSIRQQTCGSACSNRRSLSSPMGKRIVISGMGIVSCLGNDADSVTRSLYEGRSGISRRQEQIDMGMRSHVAGAPEVDISSLIDRKQLRFMGDAAAYAYIAMQQAIEDSGLEETEV